MKPFASEAIHRLFRHGVRGQPRCARVHEALLVALLCSSACERSDASLMRVTRVSQDEENHVLFVHGEGFFAGAKCTAKLSGQLFRPFGTRTSTTRSWPCRARSESEIAVRLDDDQSGIIEGALEVIFTAKDAKQTFLAVAESPVRVRLAEASLPARLAQSRAARAFAHELGLTVEIHARGLLVTHLIAGSRAAQAGVQLRDVIQRIDGSPVEKPIDLAPSPQASSPVLELARGQNVLSVPVALHGGTRRLAPGPASGLAFALAFIMVSLLPLSARPASARTVADRRRGPWWKAFDLKMLALGATLTLASAAVVSLSAIDLRWAFVTPWLTFAALELPDAWRARHRLSACLRTLLPLLGCAVGLACLSILRDERAAFLMANSAPSTWLLFGSPAAWIAWFAIQRGVPKPDDVASFSRRLAAAWLACTTSWLVAALGLGAGSWGGSEPPDALTGSAVVFIKAGALALWFLRSSDRPDSRGLWLCLAAPVATAAWLILSPSEASSALIAYACMGALLSFVVSHLIDRKDRSRLLPPDPLLEPFR